jgi:D-alanyl-D-alanine carboxypeptidase
LGLVVVVVPGASAAPTGPGEVTTRMERLLNTLRREGSGLGTGITFGDGHHDTTLSSGSRQFLVDEPIESDDLVRVGSDTKLFVASVVLQLVGEGRIELDAPLDRYLPGVLRYPADKVPGDPAVFDGRSVTIRQLLQHTAGVGDYGDDLGYVLNPWHQIVAPTPQDLLAYGVAKGPTQLPGTAFRYSNNHYTLLGMLVQSLTGRTLATEIEERIAGPLGLENTFFAESGQRALPGEHVHGYLTATVPVDMSYFEPAVWWAAGALVSTPDEMNTFMSALIAGQVVPPSQLAEMQKTIPMGDGNSYGLGIVRRQLSCGEAWGHAGFVAGYQTFGLAMADGTHAFYTLNSSIAVHLQPPASPASAYELVELALC